MQHHIDFIYFDAGGGHRAAATALKQVIESEQRPWRVRLVHLQEVLSSIDIFRKITGVDLQELYNILLRRGWTLGSEQMLRLMQSVLRLYHKETVSLLMDFWKSGPPDMVVSLVPNFNRALYQAFGKVRPGRPMVTILTDMADYPPHFWIERQKQYFICGSDRAVQQARSLGHHADRVFRVSGMILRPKFYEPLTHNRSAERVKLGLDPAKLTGVVLFGGYGSRLILKILDKLEESDLDVQLIALIGRNEKLKARLLERSRRIPIHVEGFTTEIPYFMHLGDFFIGKPGPGSISEAVQMGLPVITTRNRTTLPQERYNTEWVEQHNAGIIIPSFSYIAAAIRDLTNNGRLAKARAAVAKLENRAVFEIPPLLERILHSSK